MGFIMGPLPTFKWTYRIGHYKDRVGVFLLGQFYVLDIIAHEKFGHHLIQITQILLLGLWDDSRADLDSNKRENFLPEL